MFDNDPDSFQSVVEQLSAQGTGQLKLAAFTWVVFFAGGYLNTVVKSKVRSLQQKTQVQAVLKLCLHFDRLCKYLGVPKFIH